MRQLSGQLWIISIFVLGVSVAPAFGGVIADHRIELRPPSVAVERLFPNETSWLELALLHAPCDRVPLDFTPSWTDEEEASGPIRFQLPEMPPESLDLEIRYGRVMFLTGAEMVRGVATFTPRLDCDTRETYFWCRLCYDVDDHLTVFCESFQAAGSILGWDTDRAYQRYVWDGFQFELGARWNLSERVFLEGGPVLYALSATQRPASLGARGGITLSF
jgi:hypothetical protein